MSHARTQIRDAIVTAVTGLTTTGARVYKSRVFSLDESELPSLSVYAKAETVEQMTLGAQPTVHRRLEIAIEAHASAVSGLDTTLDTITLEVETALATMITIGGIEVPVSLDSTEIDLLGDGEDLIGVASMVWSATYATLEATPGTLVAA